MSQSTQCTLKLGLVVATALIAGVASAWVLDLMDGALARELALKSAYLSAIFTGAASLVSAISGHREAPAPLTDGRR